ncbi:hypothetical protein [Halorubrum lacusprofundi]|uniref:DUF3817 domain-containing protein n=1 Tax=Halorubrum lacusprofundi (strain ATCC 49239 / DSM 5036 / JCM 8891 / ACAM 34) TaxID=416348 RepID=B9LNL0_HALLT|nr:hypothetical protein [Halorubrum lacusprofundi]ACM56948.1 hypothetical protein Hlac_1357 [Halorubrum lacusprofundi ATCC 49239]MCG1006583.1 hypothetical protein [Halorubrum lacusprofundi]
MSTHAAASDDDPDGSAAEPPARRFDGPWLLVLAVATGGWTVLYAIDWALLSAGTPAGAAVGFAHGYLLAPLATAAILLDALSLAERGIADFGLFKWLYAVVALIAPPVAIVYYAHREWLKPGDPSLLGGPP